MKFFFSMKSIVTELRKLMPKTCKKCQVTLNDLDRILNGIMSLSLFQEAILDEREYN